MRDRLVLAIDQGTTSTRTLAFDADWRVVAAADRRLTVRHPRPDWAEQDPAEILDSVVTTVAEVLEAIGGVDRVVAVGLDNQGETALAWDAEDGRPLAPAVLWHCRRSEAIVARLAAEGLGPAIRARTGLPLDPYFSAGKWRWMLEELPEVRAAADGGTLRVGTVDAWLTERLGGVALTDPSTASRTQLLDLSTLAWERELLEWFGIPAAALPTIRPSSGTLVTLTHLAWRGDLPLTAMLCDQQAALFGHGAFDPGSVKATYGTGVFVLATVGTDPSIRADGLLTTVAWSTPPTPVTYAIDGGVFSAGSLLDWLASIGLFEDSAEADRLAASVQEPDSVRVLPALGGLAAPWWDGEARGVISGLTAGTRPAHIARAAFDGIAHRVADVVEAMAPVLPAPIDHLRVDGGLTRSDVLVQRQADLLGIPVEVAELDESTAVGVAQLAAVAIGETTIEALRSLDRPGRVVEPSLPDLERREQRDAWRRYVEAARSLTSSSIAQGQPERNAP